MTEQDKTFDDWRDGTEAEAVALWRKRYPDLTDDEERQIGHCRRTGGSLFFRCTFEDGPKTEAQIR